MQVTSLVLGQHLVNNRATGFGKRATPLVQLQSCSPRLGARLLSDKQLRGIRRLCLHLSRNLLQDSLYLWIIVLLIRYSVAHEARKGTLI